VQEEEDFGPFEEFRLVRRTPDAGWSLAPEDVERFEKQEEQGSLKQQEEWHRILEESALAEKKARRWLEKQQEEQQRADDRWWVRIPLFGRLIHVFWDGPWWLLVLLGILGIVGLLMASNKDKKQRSQWTVHITGGQGDKIEMQMLQKLLRERRVPAHAAYKAAGEFRRGMPVVVPVQDGNEGRALVNALQGVGLAAAVVEP
jgi:hypothetical protein